MKRHPQHNYESVGGYFVTFSTHCREKLLGQIDGEIVRLTPAGEVLDRAWRNLPKYYPNLTLDAYVVMPDHFHGILLLNDPKLLGIDPGKCKGLPKVIQALKAGTSRDINKLMNRTGKPIWQKGYHERVIRDDGEWEKFRYYIQTNPLRETLRNRD